MEKTAGKFLIIIGNSLYVIAILLGIIYIFIVKLTWLPPAILAIQIISLILKYIAEKKYNERVYFW